jgi:L-Ala-D/L-Glu epimerase
VSAAAPRNASEPIPVPSLRPVAVAVVHPLRMAVLRPGRPVGSSVYPGDEDPAARHIAAFVGDEVVSVGSVLANDPPPWVPSPVDGWRVRGMATRDGWRGRGLGRLVVRRGFD